MPHLLNHLFVQMQNLADTYSYVCTGHMYGGKLLCQLARGGGGKLDECCDVVTLWSCHVQCKHADHAHTWETSRAQLPACCTNPKLE